MFESNQSQQPECVGPFCFVAMPAPGDEISHGTLRYDDLLRASVRTLDHWIARNEIAWQMFVPVGERLVVRQLFHRAENLLVQAVGAETTSDPIWLDEAADLIFDFEMVIDRHFTRFGVYFGAHEGDGSAIGFWPVVESTVEELTHYWTPEIYWDSRHH